MDPRARAGDFIGIIGIPAVLAQALTSLSLFIKPTGTAGIEEESGGGGVGAALEDDEFVVVVSILRLGSDISRCNSVEGRTSIGSAGGDGCIVL